MLNPREKDEQSYQNDSIPNETAPPVVLGLIVLSLLML